MGISPNTWAMGCSSTLAIQQRMKMMPSAPCGQGWRSFLRCSAFLLPLPSRAGPAHEGLWKDRGLRQTAGMDTTNGEPRALLFAQHFATLPDPRQRLPQHPLLSILFIVLVLSTRNTGRVCNEERPDIRQSFPLLPNWEDVRDARPSPQVCDQ